MSYPLSGVYGLPFACCRAHAAAACRRAALIFMFCTYRDLGAMCCAICLRVLPCVRVLSDVLACVGALGVGCVSPCHSNFQLCVSI